MHKWKFNAHDVKFKVQQDGDSLQGALSGSTFRDLDLEVPVRGLKSREADMDRNMYKAVGADAHPMIRFRASDLRARHLGGNRYDVHASGQLTMAGKSRDIDVHGAGSLQDGNFHFEGTRDLLLSDYGVQPPVLLMGAIKVADRVVVHFDLTVGNP